MRFLRIFPILLGLACLSCGEPRFKPVYPVSGRVFYEGKPAAGAFVTFQRVIEQDDPFVRPNGTVDEDGRFTLSTYQQNDGAPAGAYGVKIIWIPRDCRGPPEKANQLPPRYADCETSRLTVEIKKENNELPTFELTK